MKTASKKISILFITILAFSFYPSKNYCSDNIKKKVNPRGQLLIHELKKKDLYKTLLSVIIEVSADKYILKLKSLNLNIRFHFRYFCTADISVENLDTLAAFPFVKKIHITNYGGKYDKSNSHKVIIGIIDKGIYWRSKIFLNNEGKNRILYLWDQTTSKRNELSTVPYGSEYDGIKLEELRNNYESLPEKWGHGTAIAGIAAGNANIIVNEKDLLQDRAPNSYIILINTTGRADHVLDAVAYIIEKSNKLDANCVINFSYGKHYGPHNGSHLYTRALDALLSDRAIMVVGIGNDGGKNIYCEKSIKSITTLKFILRDCYDSSDLLSSQKLGINLDIWHERSLSLDVFLESPTNTIIGPIRHAEYKEYLTDEGRILVINSISKLSNNFSGIFITISNHGNLFPSQGIWEIKLKSNSKGSNSNIHGWITSMNFCDAEFLDNNAKKNSISSLAASKKILSVGSYVADINNMHYEEAPFSNFGFTLDNRKKPDVLTIGEVSIELPEINDPITLCGTSVSTALMSRIIGIIWEKYPYLESNTIKNELLGTAIIFGDLNCKWKGKHSYQPLNFSSILKLFSVTYKHKKE